MAERRGGLGPGLGALLPTSPPAGAQTRGADAAAARPRSGAVEGAVYREVPPARIHPNPRQPRTSFDEEAHLELVESIRAVGVLQPVVLRQTGPEDYELVMGERRWRAAQAAGLDVLPAIVRETANDALLRDALLENLHRQQLNPLEEAAAYQQLLQEFGATHEELATRLGRSRPQISNTIRLLVLPPAVQRRVAAGVLSAGHARALLGLREAGAQERVAARVVAEGLSVRAVEELVAVDVREAPRRAPRQPRPVDAVSAAAAARLSDRLDTRVRVEVGRSKGRITIEFGGGEDLQRILSALEGGDAARPD